jgi:PHD/YefM family antitoxin component YafN of YafNO toxin-antitoxin module
MITVHPQYVVDAAQTRTAVLIPADEWEQILEALEKLDDIQAYDAAKAGPQEAVPF